MFGWLGSGTESRPFGPSVGRSDVESDGRSAGRMVGRSDGWLDSETVVRSDGRTVGRMIGWVAQSLISSSLPSPPTYRLGNGRRKNVPEICSWSQFPGLKNGPFPGRRNEAHGSGSVTILTKTARGGRCLGPASGPAELSRGNEQRSQENAGFGGRDFTAPRNRVPMLPGCTVSASTRCEPWDMR